MKNETTPVTVYFEGFVDNIPVFSLENLDFKTVERMVTIDQINESSKYRVFSLYHPLLRDVQKYKDQPGLSEMFFDTFEKIKNMAIDIDVADELGRTREEVERLKQSRKNLSYLANIISMIRCDRTIEEMHHLTR